MTTITISEFRKNTKQYLNEAVKEPVFIERGGIVFRLFREGWTSDSMKDMVITDIQHKEDGSVGLSAVPIEAEYCKSGHRLPTGREKCLQKGCKYS
jgi:hypothetical protein